MSNDSIVPDVVWVSPDAWTLDMESTCAFRNEHINCEKYHSDERVKPLVEALWNIILAPDLYSKLEIVRIVEQALAQFKESER